MNCEFCQRWQGRLITIGFLIIMFPGNFKIQPDCRLAKTFEFQPYFFWVLTFSCGPRRTVMSMRLSFSQCWSTLTSAWLWFADLHRVLDVGRCDCHDACKNYTKKQNHCLEYRLVLVVASTHKPLTIHWRSNDSLRTNTIFIASKTLYRYDHPTDEDDEVVVMTHSLMLQNIMA